MVCGRLGWVLFGVIVLFTLRQAWALFGLGLGAALGGTVNAEGIEAWRIASGLLLVLSAGDVVLAFLSRRWVLFLLALVVTFVACVMNIMQFPGIA
ncbi:hypothetical protein FBY39_3007 [Microbacterium sp. SLBN-146]|nr:hypothetical protein FBY39_3007 [Microbacterium sp. SLBN-146]